MTKRRIFTNFLLFLCCMLQTFGQESRLYMPVEIQRAYENGTRSYDGKPGSNYWQNRADYTIEVEIIPTDRMIVGSEQVVYHNLSTHSISTLVVRLYHDVNKGGAVRQYPSHAGDLTEGVELYNLSINGRMCDLEDQQKVKRGGTTIKFFLEDPLEPGEDLVLKTSWRQEIPIHDTRVGSYDSTTFFIGYWYPQISVYDDIFGWDEFNHDILNEYYNGPASFNVSVTAPEGYLVWGTGTLMNADEVYPPGILEKYNALRSSIEVISLVSHDDVKKGIDTQHSSWQFEARGVCDFSFFLSDHFAWDATSLSIDGRKVLVSTVHPPDTAIDYGSNVLLSMDAMRYFSEDVPGLAYPFEAFTTVIADGWGMEFPMMAHNSSPGSHVTIHELLHSYFPMYVHTNETRWSWMDEGSVSILQQFAMMKLLQGEQDMDYLFNLMGQGIQTGLLSDLPLMVPSVYLDDFNYGQASYSKPAFVFALVMDYLGDELFLNCYREFIARWAGKSPTPYDLFYTFEDVSGQDLHWIWKPWFFEFGYADVKIESFREGMLSISMVGNQPMPLVIDVENHDGTSRTLYESVGIWSDGRREYLVSIPQHAEVKRMVVNRDIPDADRSNNKYPHGF